MGIAENKARYEGSAFQAIMERSGHTVCDRCYCCDAAYESHACWQCEGEIHVLECLGRCDENGDHKKLGGK